MERLVSELGLLLKMLDQETVSPATADKMASVRNIMETVKPTGNGSDLYMNSCLYGNGTSFVESLFEDFGPASLPEGVSVGLRRSSKYSFHRSTTSRVEVSSAPSPPYTVLTMHCFPPPETPDGGPEPLRSRPEVVLHGLTELLPCPGFCLGNRHSCAPLGLPVPACCLWSPTGQKGPIGLLLQFDGIPHRRCPPAGSGIAATAGTDHLAATALVGRLNNGGVEHGPLGLNVPRLPRYMVKALPEVGVEALSDRRLCQTFPADPHDTFGSARSDRHSPPPSQPTHHQVVINCDLHMLSASPVEQKEQKEEEEKTIPNKSTPTDTPPPQPTTAIADDYYEEAVPPEQYLGTAVHSSGYCVEDAYYEDADDNYPSTRIDGPPKNSYNDSDAVSSSYESYEEEDDDAKGRDQPQTWAAEDTSNGSIRDCRICAFLLRKKRFGQWTKQLAVVRDNKLQCYKNIKDSTPNTELQLNLCNVIYVPKEGRKKRHELRFSLPGGEALVLAVQSKEQAQRWLKVVQEASNLTSNTESHDGAPSPIIQRKLELDKMRLSDKGASDSDSGPIGDTQAPVRDSDSLTRGKRGPLSELTGSMKKINRIISFSKKKPPLPGDPPSSSGNQDNTCSGYLSVCLSGAWKERWCVLRGGTLYLQRDPGDTRPPVIAVPLVGADVVPGGLGPKHPFSFRVLQAGKELLALEASCWEDLGRWLGVLLVKTGCGTLPEELHYDYIDVETLSDIQHAARNSFLWAKTATISSSSNSTDSRMYDEVYESVLEGSAESKPGQVRRHASFSSRGSDRTEQQAAVKRHASNVNQYGRYGKTRAEEDARRYLREKEQLEKEKELLKRTLVSIRKERREVKEQLRSGTTPRGEQRLAQLEVVCKEREEERVELELRLTEVKENLKKSLAGGALGPPTDTRISIKAQGRKVEKVYSETVPVNSASELRKRPPSYASSRGTVMQKAKEWESKQVV
ncbi:Actin filament-associated protein 1-like 1 [Merluccius polli]|uniref:Actin filament-associated protein 1-like 1 n=1 Tax=Merluccius polli TaxID=89951 RepID=A0AA47MSK3_MERPO|nr:Actin filament-associated protein 1-like 1 [Merluccius polli]